ASPRQSQLHAVQEEAVDVVGGGAGHRVVRGLAGSAADHDRLAEVERGGQLERQVAVEAAWSLDLDVDDALVARPLQVARDGRRVEAEGARDLHLALARDVKASRQVDEHVGRRSGRDLASGLGVAFSLPSAVVWRTRISSIVWPVRSRRRMETMSKKTSIAASYRLPIGSTLAPLRSSAMVWARRWITVSDERGEGPAGGAVIAAVRAPALRATPSSSFTVEKVPGPALTNSRSPLPTCGVVMSPTTCASRPRCMRRMHSARIIRPSRPTP